MAVAQDSEEAFGGAVIALPPFYVEPTDGERWTHASLPGFELLTTHDRTFARRFVRTYLQQSRVLEQFVPPRFRWRPYLPETFIVVDAQSKRSDPNDALSQTINANKSTPRSRQDQRRFLPNLRLTSSDSSINFAFMDENDIGPSSASQSGTMIERIMVSSRESSRTAAFRFSASRLSHQLTQRAPALPPWFIAGLVNLYDKCDFPTDRIVFARLKDLPTIQTDQGEAEFSSTHISLPALLSQPAPTDQSELEYWTKRAELMVRWSLFSERVTNRDALWSFLDRLPLESSDEALFQSCFDLSYAEAETQISEFYLKQTGRRSIRVPQPGNSSNKVEINTADRDTVTRILSEWERLETEHVETNFPELHGTYLERARKTIASARHNHNGSPELTAIAGLLEYDAGNSAEARVELQGAIDDGIARPLALRTLARLEFDRLGSDRPLAADSVAPVIELLLAAHRQSPALIEVYLDLAEVLKAAQLPLTREYVGVLAAGIRAYPRDLNLVTELAILVANRGREQTAKQIIGYAQARATSQRSAEALATLAARLDSTKAEN